MENKDTFFPPKSQFIKVEKKLKTIHLLHLAFLASILGPPIGFCHSLCSSVPVPVLKCKALNKYSYSWKLWKYYCNSTYTIAIISQFPYDRLQYNCNTDCSTIAIVKMSSIVTLVLIVVYCQSNWSVAWNKGTTLLPVYLGLAAISPPSPLVAIFFRIFRYTWFNFSVSVFSPEPNKATQFPYQALYIRPEWVTLDMWPLESEVGMAEPCFENDLVQKICARKIVAAFSSLLLRNPDVLTAGQLHLFSELWETIATLTCMRTLKVLMNNYFST